MKETSRSQAHWWGLADQALVSGSNFLAGLILARSLGLEAFGAYVVAQMYLLYANTFQAALVVAPLMIAVPAQTEEAEQHRLLRGYLGYALMVCGATTFCVQVLAFVFGRISDGLSIEGLAYPLGVALIAFQLQDWWRRANYALSDPRRAFASDAIAYGSFLGSISVLAASGSLNAATAFWAMAGAFGIVAGLDLLASPFRPDFYISVIVIRDQWRNSRNYLASWQLQWLASQGVILFGTSIAGQQAAGAIRAAQNLLGPVLVLFQWMDNSMPVRAALRLSEGGAQALDDYIGSWRRQGLLALTGVLACLVLTGEWLIVMAYGEEYRPFAALIGAQSLYFIIGFAYRLDSYKARALSRTIVLTKGSALWASVSLLCALCLAVGERLDALGIVAALVAGQTAAAAYLHFIGDYQEQSAESRSVPQFILLKHRDGSPWLLLPRRGRRLIRSTLAMYVPSLWKGRALRRILQLFLPTASRLGFPRPVYAAEIGLPCLQSAIDAVPGAALDRIGGLVSSGVGRSGRLILKVMDARGSALAFVRVGVKIPAIKGLEREAQILRFLSATPVACRVPRVIAEGYIGSNGERFFVETAGPEFMAGMKLQKSHYDFLEGLVTPQFLEMGLFLHKLRCQIDRQIISSQVYNLTHRGIDLLESYGFVRLPVCVEHGDFAPWNIRRVPDEGVYVIDWEHGQIDGLPWVDALHFCFQVATLVRRMDTSRVLAELRATINSDQARGYARCVASHSDIADAFVCLYLVRSIFRSSDPEGIRNAAQERALVSVLDLLLQLHPTIGSD